MALPDRNHVMLSYTKKNQSIVSRVYNILKAKNIPLYFDVDAEIEDDIYKRLSDGIENASVVCCFISPEYQESDECKLELEYAQIRHKQIIPCIVTQNAKWKPSEWLDAITAKLWYVDLTDDSEENIQSKTRELIDRIKKDDMTSKSVSDATYLIELAKYEYKRNVHIQRIMNPTKSLHIENIYINLAIVKDNKKLEKEKQPGPIKHKDSNIGGFENIYSTKTAINIHDIFESCKTQKKQILVFGRAGIGKSTFCRYVAYQWAIDSCWQQYELVAFIPLHHLTTKHYPPNKNYSFIDLIEKEVFHCDLSQTDKKILKKLSETNRILWILDGYDEIIQHIPDHLQNLFKQLLQTQTHILTSRPYLYTLPYDVQIELIGFTHTNIQQYIQNFFNQMESEIDNILVKSEMLWEFLINNRTIWDIAHIPVNLELICSIWSTGELSDKNQLTITALYTMMTDWLCRRYLTTFHKQFVPLSKEDLNQRCHKELAMLERLAFIAMKNNMIIIDSSLLKKTTKEAKDSFDQHSNLLNIGILKSFDQPDIVNPNETDMNYRFVHYSFQEYFTARYLINLLKESSSSSSSKEAIDFIKHEEYNERYVLVFSFMSGLLNDMNAKPWLNTFWDSILGEPMDLVGVREMQLVISCMEEVSDKSSIPRYSELLAWIANCIKYNVAKEINIIHRHLSQSLQRAQTIACHPTVLNVLIDLLQIENSNTKIEVLSFICELKISNPSNTFISSLLSTLDSKNEYVRWYVCEVLGKTGRKAATDEVIRKLVSCLGDVNGYVRVNACQVLGKMSEKAATNQVISNLVSALGDENIHIQRYACHALADMSEKPIRDKVISKLMGVLEDENTTITRNACHVLEMMGEKAANNEVINKLVRALKDRNNSVRCYACRLLGEMGEKVATTEVINCLVNALGDENDDVRGTACEALGKIGEKAATNQVIGKLVSLLRDTNRDVTKNASEALGKMREKAITDEVINKLVSALDDKNADVRVNACQVLGSMGEKVAKQEVISKLESALGDQNEHVRANACEALGKMGERAATKEIIGKLVRALEDKSTTVTINAYHALSMMGREAAKKDVINRLVNALRDDYPYVRINACQVLGRMGERGATIEVLTQLTNLVDDENTDVRKNACEALGMMGEKAITHDVLSKVVNALNDKSAFVRISVCQLLGKMGERAVTVEVVSRLLDAAGDENAAVRASACQALGNIGPKVATKQVLSKLASALGDKSVPVTVHACAALGKMGGKAATLEVIKKLVPVVKIVEWSEGNYAEDALEKILCSFNPITQLGPEIVAELCLCDCGLKCLENLSIKQLISIYGSTEIPGWLCPLSLFMLRERIAVISMDEKIMIYNKKETFELNISKASLNHEVVSTLIDQRKRLHLFFGKSSEIREPTKSSSGFCNIL